MPRPNVTHSHTVVMKGRQAGLATASRRADLKASEHMLQLHLAKFSKAIEQERWPDCSAALRALEDEAQHAQDAATQLALQRELSARRPSGQRR